MKHLTKNFFTCLRLILGIGLIYYILSTAGGFLEIKQLLYNPWVVVGLITLPFMGAVVESLRLGLLFKSQAITLSFSNGYRLVSIGALFNFVIPGGTGGDIMKLYYLASENRGRGVEVGTVLLVDRVVALFSMLFLTVGLALFNWQVVSSHILIKWLVVIAVLFMIGLLFFFSFSFSKRVKANKWLIKAINIIPFHHFVQRAFDAIHSFRDHKMVLIGAALWSLLGHFALVGIYLVVGRILIPDAPGIDTCLLSMLGMFANAIPITPGGLGVGEVAIDKLFTVVGYINGAQLMLAWRLGMIPVCILGGIFYIKGSGNKSQRA